LGSASSCLWKALGPLRPLGALEGLRQVAGMVVVGWSVGACCCFPVIPYVRPDPGDDF